jgi:branched-chain amino acid transport system ATP-binding protein
LGLIGPNGAGKTTLFNVIDGVYKPDRGRIIFRGQDVTGVKPYHMAHLGLSRTHQIVRPLSHLTVRENVMAGACFGREQYSLSQAAHTADEVIAFVGLKAYSDQLAGSLNVTEKKLMELARALAARPYLLMLDEVLAGSNPSEITTLLDVICQIHDQGVTILMIEHIMTAIMNVSDRLLVLDYGQLIASGPPREVAEDRRVVEAYLGDPKLAERLMRGQ